MIALVVSLVLCVSFDRLSIRRLQQQRVTVANLSADLTRVGAMDTEVQHFQTLKRQLEKRINWINFLKANQSVVSRPLAIVTALGPESGSIESVGVDGPALTINGHANSTEDVERIAARITGVRCRHEDDAAPSTPSIQCDPSIRPRPIASKSSRPENANADRQSSEQTLEDILDEPTSYVFTARVVDNKMHVDCGAARSTGCVAYLLRADVSMVNR